MKRRGRKIPSRREAQIMAALAAGKRYGLETSEAVKSLPLGTLYVVLDRLKDQGYVKGIEGASEHPRGGNRRKYFELTELGKRVLHLYQRLLRVYEQFERLT